MSWRSVLSAGALCAAGPSACAPVALPERAPHSSVSAAPARAVALPAAPGAAPVSRSLRPLPSGLEGPTSTVVSRTQRVEFPLPDADHWGVMQSPSPGLRALHRRTGSSLIVRAWKAAEPSSGRACGRQARRWYPDIGPVEAASVLRRSERVIEPAYRATVIAAVWPAAPAGVVRGQVQAFGADVRNCFAMVFSTAASGPRAVQVVAERLAAMEATTFARVRRSSIESRVAPLAR